MSIPKKPGVYGVATILGCATVLVLPADWLGYAAGTAVLFVIIMGVLCSHGAKDEKPLHLVEQLLSSIFLNTSRPNAVVKDESALRLFFSDALFFLGKVLR